MRRRTIARAATTVASSALILLLLAPVALAGIDHGGVSGEGTYGETTDRVVTNFGFAVIAFFPLLIFVLSMIQWRLDKRRDAEKAAAKAREANGAWRGGW